MIAYFVLAAGAVLALDQASKTLALHSLTNRKLLPIAAGLQVGFRLFKNGHILPRFLRLRSTLIGLWAFAVIGTILAGFCLGFNHLAVWIGLGAAVGGATGNFLDRLWRGAVIDFIEIYSWPIFNIADIGIIVGVFGSLLYLLIVTWRPG